MEPITITLCSASGEPVMTKTVTPPAGCREYEEFVIRAGDRLFAFWGCDNETGELEYREVKTVRIPEDAGG